MCLGKIVMIDTVRLAFNVKDIPEEFRFTKSKRGIFTGVINPPKELRSSGCCIPRITFIKRPMRGGIQQQMSIECSLPKLLKGSNFEEVCDADFDAIVEALRSSLWKMGIKWQFSGSIANYQVNRIDYSKNIIFRDGTIVSQILRLLNSANISKVMDVSAGDFRNGGQILHYHTNARDIAFYDKIADLKQSKRSEKRVFEDDNKCRLNLLDSIQSKRNLAVLRFEIRLNSKKEIRNALKKVDLDSKDLSFRRMFSSNLSRKVLLYWWGQIFQAIPKAPLDDRTVEKLFLDILQNPNATPQRVLATLGMYYLARAPNFDERFAREVFNKRFKNGSWGRSKKLLLQPETSSNLKRLLHISSTIREMKPINLGDIK